MSLRTSEEGMRSADPMKRLAAAVASGQGRPPFASKRRDARQRQQGRVVGHAAGIDGSAARRLLGAPVVQSLYFLSSSVAGRRLWRCQRQQSRGWGVCAAYAGEQA